MRHSNSRASFSAVALLTILTFAGTGCAPLWRQLRENERYSAIESARTYAKRGNCPEALKALDHAEASLELGRFAAEATQMRITCYERLGLNVIANAHRRLFEDFYERPDPAYPSGLENDLFRVSTIPDVQFMPVPSGYILPAPHYSDHARRSHVVGRVVVSFEITKDAKARRIRVLEMSHPLLATWAIQAVVQGRRKNIGPTSYFIPGQRYIANFGFSYHWADSGRSVDPEPDAPF